MTMHTHPRTEDDLDFRCRHLAVQSVITTVCLDCGDITEAHDQLTGLAVRGDLSDLPVYVKPC